ncbi:alpha/beta hydrolase [Asticcacaulis sp. BYS171W]|uniref:Alpha/beta hydrolase n=1 Tax=Asticcacaulis aquaticus TaxID=2984212 RepID=A0ABT5HW27_9CAUL|nr:alpha/beta hydrolase [Asticcacaulis aquaticus]MDC7684142.1 alpha/beta hydrolase [Asticcacaulis aquaticus]
MTDFKPRRRDLIAGTLVAALVTPARAQSPAPTAGPLVEEWPEPSGTIDLWPKGAPGAPKVLPQEKTTERSKDPAIHDRFTVGISQPRMAVFRPAKPNGAALLITPGGGYSWVVVDREGYEIAGHFAKLGFTCFVLFYRLPADGWAKGYNAPLADAQRAVRLIRQRAADFGIDPARVAHMGFSAGGHLCCDLNARFGTKAYEPVDAADALSARPFLSAPIYPVQSMTPGVAHMGSRKNLLGEAPTPEMEALLTAARNVTSASPPCFLVHAEDDAGVPPENSVEYRAALKAHKVPVALHLFTEGGHGFGIRKTVGLPCAAWPGLFMDFARKQGLVS